ncbi:MAG: hypothetical protein GY913_29860 [Proteobacteria bacterium]|nr:hypothetical protein [Pseudomonadota bacterium]MCP4921122.1 hypothetical protein [Pseudomonadota bacterium]
MNILFLFACSAPSSDIEATLTASELEEPDGDGPTSDPGVDPGIDNDFEGELEPLEDIEEPEVTEVDYGTPLCDDGNAASLGESLYPDLQSAIDAATPENPWVWACPGVHEGPFNVSTNFATGILGADDDVILTSADESVVTAFTWRGGLEAEPATFVLRDLTISGGAAPAGGGINATTQQLLIEDVVIRDGTASRGGGLWVSQDVMLVTLDGVSFFDNVAANGGGVFFAANEVKQVISMSDVGFFHNDATAAGGAIFMDPGAVDARLYGVYSRENTAPVGGAWRLAAAQDSENQIHVWGGGLHANTSEAGSVVVAGAASVLFEDVDFGEGDDDNNGADVQGCNESFSTDASFVHWPDGDMYCEDLQ